MRIALVALIASFGAACSSSSPKVTEAPAGGPVVRPSPTGALTEEGIPVASVDAFEAGLRQAGVDAKIYRYDAEHAFANPSNPIYDEASASDAWARVLHFLDSLGA